MTKQSAYLFECKGIQRYVFGSGRLRQVVGASDLVAGIARSDSKDDIAAVFPATGIGSPGMSRRAGDKGKFEDFRRLWRLVMDIRYPGLEFSDVEPATAGTALEASRLSYSRLTALRENSSAFLPPAGHPFLETNPRTGMVAVGRAGEYLPDYVKGNEKKKTRHARVPAPPLEVGCTVQVVPRAAERLRNRQATVLSIGNGQNPLCTVRFTDDNRQERLREALLIIVKPPLP